MYVARVELAVRSVVVVDLVGGLLLRRRPRGLSRPADATATAPASATVRVTERTRSRAEVQTARAAASGPSAAGTCPPALASTPMAPAAAVRAPWALLVALGACLVYALIADGAADSPSQAADGASGLPSQTWVELLLAVIATGALARLPVRQRPAPACLPRRAGRARAARWPSPAGRRSRIAWSAAPDNSWAEANRVIAYALAVLIGMVLGARPAARARARGHRDRRRHCADRALRARRRRRCPAFLGDLTSTTPPPSTGSPSPSATGTRSRSRA